MVGFFLGWMGGLGRGRALGVDEVKFTGMVLPTAKKITYIVNLKRVIMRKLVLGIADGIMKVDGKVIYEAKGLRVGLFTDAAAALAATLAARLTGSPPDRFRVRRMNVHETSGRHRPRHCVFHRQQCRGSRRSPCATPVPALSRRRITSGWASARQVHGILKIDLDEVVDRRARRFQGDGAGYCWVAMNQAIADAGLEEKDISNPRTGLIVGSGGAVDQSDRRRRRHHPPEQFAQAGRALRGAQGDVVHLQRQSFHLVQDQGRAIIPSPRPARPRPTASAMPLR